MMSEWVPNGIDNEVYCTYSSVQYLGFRFVHWVQLTLDRAHILDGLGDETPTD